MSRCILYDIRQLPDSKALESWRSLKGYSHKERIVAKTVRRFIGGNEQPTDSETGGHSRKVIVPPYGNETSMILSGLASEVAYWLEHRGEFRHLQIVLCEAKPGLSSLIATNIDEAVRLVKEQAAAGQLIVSVEYLDLKDEHGSQGTSKKCEDIRLLVSRLEESVKASNIVFLVVGSYRS